MRPSLRFLTSLVVVAFVAGAVSVVTLASQGRRQGREAAEQLAGGSVERGKAALGRYGCGGCHTIRGVDGAAGRTGPSLNGIALRSEIAGRLSNRTENMVRWIRHPQEIDPGNGMPDLGVSDADARDVAAYLYTLKLDM